MLPTCSILLCILFAIDKNINNIIFPTTKKACRVTEKEWCDTLEQRHNFPVITGTLTAGDGLAIEINKPTIRELKGSDVAGWMNRKGFFAIVCQAFCDAYTMFQIFDVMWPGATNDVVAYRQSMSFTMVVEEKIPSWCHFVLDEAYSACGGIHLTPWSKEQLRAAKDISEVEYQKRLAFNFFLSSQRITIERAFGILVRRWGILWRPLVCSLDNCTLIATICAKLHNVCVADWKTRNGHLLHPKAYGPCVPEHGDNMEDLDAMEPEDLEIQERLSNQYYEGLIVRARKNTLRADITEQIYCSGWRVDRAQLQNHSRRADDDA